MSWTDERINTLKKMWGAGKSASEIAEKLGGVTRNAVIGKAHRLGLSGRPSPIKKTAPKKAASSGASSAKKTVAKPSTAKPKAAAPAKRAVPPPAAKASPVVVRAPANIPSNRAIEILQLAALANASSQADGSIIPILELSERTCRWPVGDPKDPNFGYCGAETYAGHPYCAEHVAIAFQAPNRKDKKPAKALNKDSEIEEELEDIEVKIEDDDTDTSDDTLTDDLDDDDDTPVVMLGK